MFASSEIYKMHNATATDPSQMRPLQLFVSILFVALAMSTFYCLYTNIAAFVSCVVGIALPTLNRAERHTVAARAETLKSERIERVRRRTWCLAEHRKDRSDYSDMSKYYECVQKCNTAKIVSVV